MPPDPLISQAKSDQGTAVDRDAAEYWMGVSIAADAEVDRLRAENERLRVECDRWREWSGVAELALASDEERAT